jgi:two-component system NtrC family sensor kinase
MKIWLCLFLFLFSAIDICFSQDSAVHIDKISSEGILLDKGWRFHAGDDLTWANPEYDDKRWESIDPTNDIRHIPQFKSTNIGWLRLKLKLDSQFRKSNLTFILSQVGASEIYVNGRLAYQLGLVNDDYAKEKTYRLTNNPIPIYFDSSRLPVVAIRYSFVRKNFLVDFAGPNPCFRAIVSTTVMGFAKYVQQDRFLIGRYLIIIALYFMLGLLSAYIYFFLNSEKVYLNFTLYSIFLSVGYVLNLLGWLSKSAPTSGVDFLISQLMLSIGSLFAFLGVYRFFDVKRGLLFKPIVIYAVCSWPFLIFMYDSGNIVALSLFLLQEIEAFRIAFAAMKKKKPGSTIFFIAQILFTSLFFWFLVLLSRQDTDAAVFVGFFALIILPLNFSIMIARDFARIGQSLNLKVKEVVELSKKNLEQEQEKRQIMADQNMILEKKVEERTYQLNESLLNLQNTQKQLIQSEKMASLGELTAGIAHEIQNPLNFVNNFSEVTTELLGELREDSIQKLPDTEKENAMAIIKDAIENLQKITHHGKRADAIVKGMLQHSRSSTGIKEPSDINKLADEYLRLAYHGIHAKENSFNAIMKTDFDVTIGKVNIIPQDIGRVLLNLYNNAFYAVNEKTKQQIQGYEPTVTLSTKKMNDKVVLTVMDNGNGIPQKVIDKIFQPFFTTKPTGQGTGLGLSLSYDIVKAHGGELKVETKEGEYAEFIIQLPISA